MNIRHPNVSKGFKLTFDPEYLLNNRDLFICEHYNYTSNKFETEAMYVEDAIQFLRSWQVVEHCLLLI